jgi:hypothetical protein
MGHIPLQLSHFFPQFLKFLIHAASLASGGLLVSKKTPPEQAALPTQP